MFVSSNVWADIGSVGETKGISCQIERNKQKLPGNKGASIESMDTYITGGCVADIKFKDDTNVKVNENSRLLIDDFVFDPKQSDAGKLALKVGMGTVRYASGQIAKNNPQQVGIKTPTATIAVRGTDFTMTVDEAGQSLIVLVPSCKDKKDIKQYELQENICAVGKIDVTTLAGTVSLDKAYEATYVQSATMSPSLPTTVNIIESKISNNLILVKPLEVQKVVKESSKSPKDKEVQAMEEEMARRLVNQVSKNTQDSEARLLSLIREANENGCDPTTNVCISWENSAATDTQGKGKGIAFRVLGSQDYAEVKTFGFASNTSVFITQNYSPGAAVIGTGTPGGNIVTIIQNPGVPKQ